MIRPRARCTGLLVLALTAQPVLGQESPILSTPPRRPDASTTYLIYLHGAIIETQGRRPTSPQFGVYEYDAVLEALSGPGRVVISEQRPANTVVSEYGKVVVGQVEGLIDQGVPPSHIAVVGFSKGGKIAIATSALLETPITYVFLAACNTDVYDAYTVHGRILSIYEESDVIGRTCQPLFEHSLDVREADEIRISTGAKHGAFYRPRPEWVGDVIAWVEGTHG